MTYSTPSCCSTSCLLSEVHTHNSSSSLLQRTSQTQLTPDAMLTIQSCNLSSSQCISGTVISIPFHAEEHVHLTYSLAYSPPEVLNKVQDGHVHVHASCSMDMWALGVIAYELAVRGPAFPVSLWPRSAIMEAATGHRPYPWEQKVGIFSKVPELCSLERIVQQCLARNPKKRPTADQFCSVLSTVNAPSNAASVSVRSL